MIHVVDQIKLGDLDADDRGGTSQSADEAAHRRRVESAGHEILRRKEHRIVNVEVDVNDHRPAGDEAGNSFSIEIEELSSNDRHPVSLDELSLGRVEISGPHENHTIGSESGAKPRLPKTAKS